MIIKKGQLLEIKHLRKGTFMGIAKRDFDTEQETFFPVALAKGRVEGMSEDWVEGEDIPCRATQCTFTVV